jgi:tetratricopeptide (TPR) repeat protein
LTHALELARKLGHIDTEIFAGINYLRAIWAPKFDEERVAIAERILSLRPISSDVHAGLFYFGLLGTGKRADFDRGIQRFIEHAALTRSPNSEIAALGMRGISASLDGRLDEAKNFGELALALGRECGLEDFANAVRTSTTGRALLHLGMWEPLRTRAGPVRPVALAMGGRLEELTALFDETLELRRSVDPKDDETPGQVDMALLESALLVDNTDIVRFIYERHRSTTVPLAGSWWHVSVARLLGDAASRLGEIDSARTCYERAIEDCRHLRHRPELALARFGLAELLLEHYPEERGAAIDHLDFAISEFREMRMQPSLERALRHRGLLKA